MSKTSPFSFKKDFDIVPKPELKDFNPAEIIKSRRKNDFLKKAQMSEEEMTKLDDELMNRFDAMKDNTTTLQDKNELYDLIHEKSNLDKLYYLLRESKNNIALHKTPAHLIFVKIFLTIQKIWKGLVENQEIDLSPTDKFYFGLALLMMAIIIAILFN
jgi:hypothetical protein